MPLTLPDLTEVVAAETHPPVFATVSGAHLYGFPSADSDIDLRGVHLLAEPRRPRVPGRADRGETHR
ncbi:DNA polymerase beta superfamily protein [Actinokineospora sp.]|uniref:DNA polymerase beta superfamily protein n=1 Tax=Actinokineospora sp. TaxID=1872133 RepID=UPI003D6B157F